MDIEHPDITHARRTGYPRPPRQIKPTHAAAQPREYDYLGSVIRPGDHQVETPTGEIVLHKNLQRYLEKQGYYFNYYMGD